VQILFVVAIRNVRFVSTEERIRVYRQLNIDASESVLRRRLKCEKYNTPKGKMVNIPLQEGGFFLKRR